jgi:acetyl-CoA carboxylase biotin carboxylase subunit
MFKRILVANRGEIAVRIIRACHDLGITAIAVYSEADKHARHVQLADEAYLIGPAPASQSYLVAENIIAIAHKSDAQAIHPGYGFLSENAGFATKVKKADLVFIGPSPEAISLMGDKMAARKLMQKAGVPVVPGTTEPLSDQDQAIRIANQIGFPILIKAAGGGGGKGMRVVRESKDVSDSLRAASSEAKSAFGDDRVYIEKYLSSPRHIEIQIMADSHGNCIHLGERECSIQRRHQKVLEESPSPVVDSYLREKLGQAAIAAAKSCNYLNAGTIEFLLDTAGEYYFLEMNTRLQVEHPVTELVTGLDMVTEQIRIASGKPLSLNQNDIKATGHAIECRVNAEDPRTYLPSVGVLNRYQEPAGPGIRIDSGVTRGSEITVYYDSLLAKMIAYGKDRAQAIARMRRALDEFIVSGLATNIELHKMILSDPEFQAGNYSTYFLENKNLNDAAINETDRIASALAAALISHNRPALQKSNRKHDNKWAALARQQMLRSRL